MSGLLGTGARFEVDIIFLLEIAVLAILIVGYNYKKNKKLRTHGLTMTTAVILHTAAILTVMIPSVVMYGGLFLAEITNPGVILTLIHIFAGSIADAIGIFLVAEWRFRQPPKMTCIKRKRLMKPLLGLWILALILGVVFYVVYYVL